MIAAPALSSVKITGEKAAAAKAAEREVTGNHASGAVSDEEGSNMIQLPSNLLNGKLARVQPITPTSGKQ